LINIVCVDHKRIMTVFAIKANIKK